MAIYKEDIVDIELESGTIQRSFLNHSIGLGDIIANRFGVRLFRNGEPVSAEESSCIGFFMRPDGTNLQIHGSTYTGVSGNKAYVSLPQDAYAYEGQFTLAIKLVGGGVTGTMRIVDGIVNNTGATGAVSPTSTVPTTAEIIAAYEQATALINGVVRHDIAQSLNDTSKGRARSNIGAAKDALVTESVYGLMSATDKIKLNGIEAEANKTLYDTTLTQSGQAADAAATGKKISYLTNALDARTLTNKTKRLFAPVLAHVVNRSLVENETTGVHMVVSVKTGDILDVSGFVYDTTTYPLIILVNGSSPVGAAGDETTGSITDYRFIVPDGVDTIYVNGSANTGSSGTPAVKKTTDSLDDIEQLDEKTNVDLGVYIDKTTTTSAGVAGKTLAINTGTGKHCIVPVLPGETYLISGFEYDNGYPLAIFANNGRTACGFVEVRTGKLHNIEVLIPEGVNQLYINCNGSPDPADGGAGALLVVKKPIDEYFKNAPKWERLDTELLQGNIGATGNYQDTRGIYTIISVSGGEIVKVRTYETIYPVILAYNGDTIIDTKRVRNVNWTWIEALEYKVPDNATKIIVNGQNGVDVYMLGEYASAVDKDKAKAGNPWQGKKCAWFGTSIPAAGFIGDSHVSYPGYVGTILGMEVTNEAVGTSCVHCKRPDRVSDDNPYGFVGDFEMSSRCLSNTAEEMEWIIENYDSSIWTSGTVAEMTTELANYIRSFSYESKLDKYLEDGKEPDIFVFDHGNNDAFNTIEEENAYYAEYGQYTLYTFRGAMNFLIQRILNYDPYARIIMIGQYNGKETDKIETMQLQVAEDWQIPICRQWELLGWTKSKSITCKGHWATFYAGAYIWVDDPTESNTMTVFARWVPDGLHPHTDVTGKALRHMANTIAAWMIGIAPE